MSSAPNGAVIAGNFALLENVVVRIVALQASGDLSWDVASAINNQK